jgi:3-oxoacyl-[acyl-carrier protein] reductase
VNSILPTATEGAGADGGGVKPELREFIKSFRPLQPCSQWERRTMSRTSRKILGDVAAPLSGPHLLVTGGAPV